MPTAIRQKTPLVTQLRLTTLYNTAIYTVFQKNQAPKLWQ